MRSFFVAIFATFFIGCHDPDFGTDFKERLYTELVMLNAGLEKATKEGIAGAITVQKTQEHIAAKQDVAFLVTQLDERECVVYWLGGQPLDCKMPRTFDFRKKSLLDTDADGWLEYWIDAHGVYTLVDGQIGIKLTKSEVTISFAEIQEKFADGSYWSNHFP